MTVAEENVRQTGKTASEEAVEELRKQNEVQVTAELPEERERSFRFPGFSRIRTEWYGEDGMTMRRVHAQVEDIIDTTFHDMFAIRQELYQLVRMPEFDPRTKEVQTDRHGWVVWQRTATGNYVEDWGQLGYKQREQFLFQITTRLFEWEERRDRLWAEAMMSKTQWEEAFSEGWLATTGGRPTEGDKTANGRKESVAERYFAVYVTYLSRRADSLVQGMGRLEQRLKDVHTNGSR